MRHIHACVLELSPPSRPPNTIPRHPHLPAHLLQKDKKRKRDGAEDGAEAAAPLPPASTEPKKKKKKDKKGADE